MRIYFDNCALNRPFDNQSQIRIRLEAEAKLHIQEQVLRKEFELAWSYILDYESQANPFRERRRAVQSWKTHAVVDAVETEEIVERAGELAKLGLKVKDALHVASAIAAGCGYLITTDDVVLRIGAELREIAVMDPVTFVREVLR